MAASAYRDRQTAVAEREAALAERIAAFDTDVSGAPSSKRLPRVLRARVERLRDDLHQADGTVESLMVAEQAADRLEATLDEALGLGAELGKSVEPLLPRWDAVWRWGRLSLLSFVLLGAVVHQLGLGDFMWRALGAGVERAHPDLAMSYGVRDAVVGVVLRAEAPPEEAEAANRPHPNEDGLTAPGARTDRPRRPHPASAPPLPR